VIGRLHGTLVDRVGTRVIIDCGGVGYEVTCSGYTLAGLPALGEVVTLLIHTAVRETEIALYGFGSATTFPTEYPKRLRMAHSRTNRADTGILCLGKGDERTDDSDDRTEQSDERSRRTNGSQTGETALQFRCLNSDRSIKCTLRGFHLVCRDIAVALMGREFLQSSRNDHRKVRIFVSIADADRLIDIAVLERHSNLRGVLPRLLSRLVIGEPTLDTNRDHIDRLNEE